MSEINRPQIVLVNRCIIKNDDALLLIQRSANDNHNPGLWEFPGGKLDGGQDLASALGREVLEETGLTVEATSPLVYADSYIITTGKYTGLPYVVLFGIGRIVSGEVQLSDEHDDYAWATYDAALTRNMTRESEKALKSLGSMLLASE